MKNFKRFEVWLADLDPSFGTEPGKKRPVLIIQSDLLNKKHPSTIVCPVTSKIRKNAKILRVNIPKNSAGLNEDSAIMIDQVRSVDNKRLLRKIGDLPETFHEKVTDNLKIIMDL
ncbi:MAG: type II toxin-antitoxin system PemK/MazF family toxin [Bacteroidota bacterium]